MCLYLHRFVSLLVPICASVHVIHSGFSCNNNLKLIFLNINNLCALLKNWLFALASKDVRDAVSLEGALAERAV